MAGLGAYLLAGAAQGVGENLIEQGKAKREAAIRSLELQREMAFRRGEREAGQEFSAGENERQRNAQVSMNTSDNAAANARHDKAIAAGADVFEDAEGNVFSRVGNELTPLKMGEKQLKGKPKYTALEVAKLANERANAEIEAGGITDPIEKKAIRDAAMKEVRVDLGLDKPEPESVAPKSPRVGAAEEDSGISGPYQLGAAIRDSFTGSKRPDGSAKPLSTEAPRIKGRPKGMSDAEIIKEAKQAINAGKDPEALRARLTELGIDPKAAGL